MAAARRSAGQRRGREVLMLKCFQCFSVNMRRVFLA